MKVNLIFSIFSLALMTLLCNACSHKKSVPIINHSKSVFGKSTRLGKNKYAELKGKNSIKKTNDNTAQSSANPDQIEVETGDTLYSISKKYQVQLRDLIEANNLSAPYFLKKGSLIKIPHPTYYTVKSGDTLYSVSREQQMNINDIVALNDLKEPYKLSAGQLLKVKNNLTTLKEDKKSNTQNNKQGDVSSPEEQIKKPSATAEKILDDKNNKFSWPIKGAIISKFGPKKGGLYNDGINIKAKEGSIIKASEDGLVAYVGNELKGYGNLVIIKHSGGWITAYAHLSKTTVKRGEKIKKGHSIGFAGATGNVDSPQLYFGLRKGRDAVNPESYLVAK